MRKMHFKDSIVKISVLRLAVMLALAVAACGGKESGKAEAEVTEEENKTDDHEEKVIEEEAVEETGEEASEDNVYIEAYRDLVNELSESGKADQFMLSYIDTDEIPELLACHSEGPYDADNTFIYTISNDEPVLLISVIAGVDGGSLSYSENNLIRLTGSPAGMTDVYFEIKDGALEEKFRAEMINTLQTDENGDEVFKYSVNGEEVSAEDYEKQLADFNTENAPFVVIDYDGLNVMEVENGQFEQIKQLAYWSQEDTMDMLDSMIRE